MKLWFYVPDYPAVKAILYGAYVEFEVTEWSIEPGRVGDRENDADIHVIGGLESVANFSRWLTTDPVIPGLMIEGSDVGPDKPVDIPDPSESERYMDRQDALSAIHGHSEVCHQHGHGKTACAPSSADDSELTLFESLRFHLTAALGRSDWDPLSDADFAREAYREVTRLRDELDEARDMIARAKSVFGVIP